MTYEIGQISFDLIQGRLLVALNKNDPNAQGTVVVNVPMHKHAYETEAAMTTQAKLVAKQALEEALKAL